jgi:hypothetical protein
MVTLQRRTGQRVTRRSNAVVTATISASVECAKAPTGPRKARPDDKLRAVPTTAFREGPMSRYRRLKIEGGALFFTLALADGGRGSPQIKAFRPCPNPHLTWIKAGFARCKYVDEPL